jgi:hypothetical protein
VVARPFFHKSVFYQFCQSLGQKVCGDPSKAALQVGKPRWSGMQVSQDQQRPAITNTVQSAGNGAKEFVGARFCHLTLTKTLL